MRYKLLLPALLFSFIITAQTPGYMGKHCTLGYSLNIFPSAVGASKKSTDPGLNTTHCFNFEYVIKNRTIFCMSVQTLKTGMAYDGEINTSSGSYEYAPKPYIPMQLHSTNVVFGFKFFKKGTFAPVGKYRKLELSLLFSRLTYGNRSFKFYDYYASSSDYVKIGTGDYRYNTFSINYTIGRQRVFFDRLVLDYGIQFSAFPGIVVGAVLGDVLDFNSSAYETTNLSDRFKNQSNVRLLTHQLVNFHLGLGFLAF